MGLSWAILWVLVGLTIGVASKLLPQLPWHYFFDVFDAPLPAMAWPGFVGGALFSVVLATAGRHRRFDELSLPRFVAWGALGGLLLSLVPAAMVAVGLAHISPSSPGPWWLTGVIAVPLTLLSAASAAVSLLLARRAEVHGLPNGSAAVGELDTERAAVPPPTAGSSSRDSAYRPTDSRHNPKATPNR